MPKWKNLSDGSGFWNTLLSSEMSFPMSQDNLCNLLDSPRWESWEIAASISSAERFTCANFPLSLTGCPVASRHNAISLLGEFQLQFASLLGGVPSDTLSLSPLWSFQSRVGSIPDNPYGLAWEQGSAGFASNPRQFLAPSYVIVSVS